MSWVTRAEDEQLMGGGWESGGRVDFMITAKKKEVSILFKIADVKMSVVRD